MTMFFLAQATQPTTQPSPIVIQTLHGMNNWSVGEWISFFGVLTGFMTLTLTPFLWKILTMYKQMVDYTRQSLQSSTEASIKAEDAKQRTQVNTDHLFSLAQLMPPPPTVSAPAPAAPSPAPAVSTTPPPNQETKP